MDNEERLEHLPIGSVIMMKGATRKVIIVGHGRWIDGELYDYDICLFPEGLNLGRVAVKDCDVEKVFSIGYYDEKAKELHLKLLEDEKNDPRVTASPINHLENLVIEEDGYVPEKDNLPNTCLPVGAVVTDKAYPDQKLMIIGHKGKSKGKERDYVCCGYPYGFSFGDNALFLLNNEDIHEILYAGYYNKEQEKYMDQIDKDIEWHRNKPKGFFGRRLP